MWRSHVGLARQGWTGGPQYGLLCIRACAPLVAVCLVIACVQRAGNCMVRVVRWDRMVSLEQVCREDGCVIQCYNVNRTIYIFYNKWPEIGLYKLNYWTLPGVINHPSHHNWCQWPGLHLVNWGWKDWTEKENSQDTRVQKNSDFTIHNEKWMVNSAWRAKRRRLAQAAQRREGSRSAH